jgi:hypothetical protein
MLWLARFALRHMSNAAARWLFVAMWDGYVARQDLARGD